MRFRFWLGFAAVLGIVLVSIGAALIVHSSEQNNFDRRQQDEAMRSARQAEAVAALSIGQLASTAAFYRVEGNFKAHKFAVLGHSLLDEGGLSATGFAARVRQSQRAVYERTHGFPIVERRNGELVPARRHPEYFPVTYSLTRQEGGRRVRPAFGYDLGTDPYRGPILREAATSGEAAATAVVPLVADSGHGLIIYQPVYRDGAPTGTVPEREAALIGFASGVFRVGKLAAAATASVPGDVDVQLRQGKREIAGDPGSLEDVSTAPIHLADRTWLLILHDPGAPSISLPALLAVIGIALAALLGALILVWSRNERMQELERQAGQDSLTGLRNRRSFEEELRREMALASRQGATGAMLMIDLDHFKQVNDTLGHPAGDELIKEVAAVLARRARETDVLARLGGDEFAIVLPHSGAEEARLVAESIVTTIREQTGDSECPITASVGIAMFGEDPRISSESVVSEADTAMYRAKDGGRDGVRLFDHVVVGEEDPS